MSEAEEKLLETFGYFQGFLQRGNYDSASVYLATVFYCLPNTSQQMKKRLEKLVGEIEISPEIVQAACEAVEKRIARINQIISVGSVWNEDEILLLIQTRIQIDMLCSFLERFGAKSEADLSEIDWWFHTAAVSTLHQRHFDSVIKMIKRNWKIPIVSKWLDINEYQEFK